MEIDNIFGPIPITTLSYKNNSEKFHWIPDHQASFCMHCNVPFNFLFRRKHHCRQCGHVICSSCLVTLNEQKTCHACVAHHQNLKRKTKASRTTTTTLHPFGKVFVKIGKLQYFQSCSSNNLLFVKVTLTGTYRNGQEWNNNTNTTVKQTQMNKNNNQEYYYYSPEREEAFAFDVWKPNGILKIQVLDYINDSIKLEQRVPLNSLMDQNRHSLDLINSDCKLHLAYVQHTFSQPQEFLSHFVLQQQQSEFKCENFDAQVFYKNFMILFHNVLAPAASTMNQIESILCWEDHLRSLKWFCMTVVITRWFSQYQLVLLVHLVLLLLCYSSKKEEEEIVLLSSDTCTLVNTVISRVSTPSFLQSLTYFQNQMASWTLVLQDRVNIYSKENFGSAIAIVGRIMASAFIHSYFSNDVMLTCWVIYFFIAWTVPFNNFVQYCSGAIDAIKSLGLQIQYYYASSSSSTSGSANSPPPPTTVHTEYTSTGWRKKHRRGILKAE